MREREGRPAGCLLQNPKSSFNGVVSWGREVGVMRGGWVGDGGGRGKENVQL